MNMDMSGKLKASPAKPAAAEADKIKAISDGIRAAEVELRERYGFLEHQNTIGMTIMLVSLAGMIGAGYLYFIGAIPALACVLISAVFASLSHELEHDLIHRMYFRKNKFMQNLMMTVVWIMRPNTVNPWYRRELHFLHHKTSGTHEDVEERLLGNGLEKGFTRFIVMFDSLAGLLLRHKQLGSASEFSLKKILNSGAPLTFVHYGSWYIFLAYHLSNLVAMAFGTSIAYPEIVNSAMMVINFMVVVWIAPNVVRSGSLNFVSSNMHYYGNVNSVLQQCQVLRGWKIFPFHLFCFNFGSTHAIHHFVVGQPFYLRQMVASKAHKVMRENGVRFNDFSTFLNTNRYLPNPA